MVSLSNQRFRISLDVRLEHAGRPKSNTISYKFVKIKHISIVIIFDYRFLLFQIEFEEIVYQTITTRYNRYLDSLLWNASKPPSSISQTCSLIPFACNSLREWSALLSNDNSRGPFTYSNLLANVLFEAD